MIPAPTKIACPQRSAGDRQRDEWDARNAGLRPAGRRNGRAAVACLANTRLWSPRRSSSLSHAAILRAPGMRAERRWLQQVCAGPSPSCGVGGTAPLKRVPPASFDGVPSNCIVTSSGVGTQALSGTIQQKDAEGPYCESGWYTVDYRRQLTAKNKLLRI